MKGVELVAKLQALANQYPKDSSEYKILTQRLREFCFFSPDSPQHIAEQKKLDKEI